MSGVIGSDDIQDYDSDHTALVHVLWGIENDGLSIAQNADEIASRIMQSKWMRAVKLHARVPPPGEAPIPTIHGAPVEVGQRWQFKRGRGIGSFRVKGVVGDRITMQDSWDGKIKTVGVKTLSSDYERMEG